jgi:hypothetical protein
MRSLVCLLVFAGCAKNVARDEALARATRRGPVAISSARRSPCATRATSHPTTRTCAGAPIKRGSPRRPRPQAARTCTDIAPTLAAVDRCLAAVAQIRKLTPADPEAARLAEAASRQHLARCFADSPAWQTSLDAAVELVRCQDARAAQIAVPIYMQQLDSTRVDAREQVLRLADHPSYADRHGAKSELLATAACLAPIPDLVERARAGRAAFVDRARASIDLRATTSTSLPDLCATAAAALDGRAVCASRAPARRS